MGRPPSLRRGAARCKRARQAAPLWPSSSSAAERLPSVSRSALQGRFRCPRRLLRVHCPYENRYQTAAGPPHSPRGGHLRARPRRHQRVRRVRAGQFQRPRRNDRAWRDRAWRRQANAYPQRRRRDENAVEDLGAAPVRQGEQILVGGKLLRRVHRKEPSPRAMPAHAGARRGGTRSARRRAARRQRPGAQCPRPRRPPIAARPP